MKNENRFGVVVHQGEVAILGAVAAQTKPAGNGLFERLKFDGMSAEDAVNLAVWLIVKADEIPPGTENALPQVIALVRQIQGKVP